MMKANSLECSPADFEIKEGGNLFVHLMESLERFTAGFETMDASSKRNLLANILEKVEVLENEIVLHIKNPDMPLPKEKNAKGDFVNLGGTDFSTRRRVAPRG